MKGDTDHFDSTYNRAKSKSVKCVLKIDELDVSDHGNSKLHPKVPHQHSWQRDKNGKMIRKDWEDIVK